VVQASSAELVGGNHVVVERLLLARSVDDVAAIHDVGDDGLVHGHDVHDAQASRQQVEANSGYAKREFRTRRDHGSAILQPQKYSRKLSRTYRRTQQCRLVALSERRLVRCRPLSLPVTRP